VEKSEIMAARKLVCGMTTLCFLAIFSLTCWAAQAASLRIDIQGAAIDLAADDVPLIDILDTISRKSGLIVKSADPPLERVSYQLSAIPLENLIKQLLSNRNYVMVYKERDERWVLAELWIGMPEEPANSPVLLSSPADHMLRPEKEWFIREVKGEINLMKQISAVPVSIREENPQQKGIQIFKISKNSFFQKIALEPGDIIVDVNGRQVSTIEGFIEALQSSTDDNTPIRINRQKSGQLTEPVYIHLK
jgi:hypothetical protein